MGCENDDQVSLQSGTLLVIKGIMIMGDFSRSDHQITGGFLDTSVAHVPINLMCVSQAYQMRTLFLVLFAS